MLATDWVAYNAQRYGDLPALEDVATSEVLTWADVEERVARVAGVLADRHAIAPGDRVALLAENDVRLFLVQFALMRLRATLVPLNWRLSQAELCKQVALCEPSLLVHDQDWAKVASSVAGSISTWAWGGGGAADFDAVVDRAEPIRASAELSLDDVSHVLFTSGSTGDPKGAQITLGNLAWQASNVAHNDLIDGPGDKVLSVLPLFHAGGLNALPNPVLLSGGCVAVVRRFEAERCLALLADAERGFTHTVMVPIMLSQIAARPEFATASFPTMRHLQLGGGALSPSIMSAFADKGLPVQAHYGGTELGPGVSGVPRDMAMAKPGSCGVPFQHTQVRLVGEDGHHVPIGQTGEIWLAGPSISIGYFGPDPRSGFEGEWFRTGDLGRFDDDGYLYIVDRLKDMYKTGGENVFPAEVESVLSEHPAIREIVVVGVPDVVWGETGVAVYSTHDCLPLSPAAIEEFCEGRLAHYKIPRILELVDSLPRNVTGKVPKNEIRAAHVKRSLAGDDAPGS